MRIETLICDHIRDLKPYEPPDRVALAARSGIRPDQLIRLDANENPFGPSPCVAQALARFNGYGVYPNRRAIQSAVARYASVAPEQVVLGNGGDEIIDIAVRTFIEPGEAIVVCPPAFSMYGICALAHRGRVLSVPRRADFSLDVEGIETLVRNPETGVRPKLLFLISPGNPEGLPIPHETIRRLLQLPLAVLVDEAYIEFGGETVVPLLNAHPNLLVLRTFSKWAGIAGLRLGYAVTSPELAGFMERLRISHNVNAAAIVAALATFDDMAHVRSTISRIVAERERLYAALDAMPGVRPMPSQANFILCRLDDRLGQEVADELVAQGILVRRYSDPSLADTIRITIGRPDQNDALLAALASILGLTPHASRTTHHASHPLQLIDRHAHIHRQTRETDVAVSLHLDGTGHYETDTGLGFLDHMLAQLAAHGLFDLTVQAQGDLEIDEHHTVEDVAIVLGQALDEALGDREGIARMGHTYAPLDEALAHVVVDLSGRPYAVIEAEFSTPRVGAVGTDLIAHFLETLAVHARMSLHARVLYGRNDHHKIEALFKALGRALDAAARLDPRRQGVPSTKGAL
jgi:histidinol-phosphate aminotransferase